MAIRGCYAKKVPKHLGVKDEVTHTRTVGLGSRFEMDKRKSHSNPKRQT